MTDTFVTVTAYHRASPDAQSATLDDLSDLLTEDGAFVWIDVDAADPQTLRSLQDQLGLHPLAVEDALHAHQRPKIEQYGDTVFVVAYQAETRERRVTLHEVSVFAARGWAVTVRHGPTASLKELRQRVVQAPDDLRARTIHFLYAFLDCIVDDYFAVTDALQDRVEEVEETLIFNPTERAGLESVFALRRDVIYFRRAVSPLREVLNVLVRRDEAIAIEQGLREYFRDLYDHIVRVHEELETAHELISAALDAHLSVVSNRMNSVVLRVSAWAAIIALPTVIASIYGMNFDHMPELHWMLGYPYSLGLMAGSAVGLYAYFRRRHWL